MIYNKTGEPIRVGETYRNGMSLYKVETVESLLGFVRCHRPKDGWSLKAHGAALYRTPSGVQMLWDYSTNGHFDETKMEASHGTKAVE